MAADERTWKSLGEFIRSQRRLADLSLRQLANLTKVSNPYLSQIERGIYRPSAEVLKSIADALQISAENLYARVGLLDRFKETDGASEKPSVPSVEKAIRLDPKLSTEQKTTLIRVYRGLIGSGSEKVAKPT